MDRLTGSQSAATHPHVHGNRIGQPPGAAGLMQRLEQICDCAHADPAVRNADPSFRPKVHHDLGAHTGLVPDDTRFPEKKLSYEIFHILNVLLVSGRGRTESKSPLPPFLKVGEAMWSHAKHGGFSVSLLFPMPDA